MEKGRQIGLSGELVQDRWENDNGEKRSKVKINARNVKFLSGGNQDSKQQNKNEKQDDIEVPF